MLRHVDRQIFTEDAKDRSSILRLKQSKFLECLKSFDVIVSIYQLTRFNIPEDL